MPVIDCYQEQCFNISQTFSRDGIVYPITAHPTGILNILFIAFHSNPIGGYLNVYWTIHHLRHWYYWPGINTYMKKMCSICPGCPLSNPMKAKPSKLVNNFPIKALFLVLHVNAYKDGTHLGFEGLEAYLVACCEMCIFNAS
jgi:hypothetical protein